MLLEVLVCLFPLVARMNNNMTQRGFLTPDRRPQTIPSEKKEKKKELVKPNITLPPPFFRRQRINVPSPDEDAVRRRSSEGR